MEGHSATGWLSTDYGMHLADGRAIQSAPPSGDPRSWLSGYAPNTTCLYEVLTPPGSAIWVTLMHNEVDDTEDTLDMFAGTLETALDTAAVVIWNGTTASGTTALLHTGTAGAPSCSMLKATA
jgi:hypothetical protein